MVNALSLVPMAPLVSGGETPRDADGVEKTKNSAILVSSESGEVDPVYHPCGEGTGDRPTGGCAGGTILDAPSPVH